MNVKQREVILFMDSDLDDLFSINLLLSAKYHGSIKLIGIVCDDGFLSYPENVRIANFWVYDILKCHDIDIYKGLERNDYLKQERNYPPIFVTSYIKNMEQQFNYDSNKVDMKYKNLDSLVEKIDKECKNIDILATSNLTSLSYLLNKKDFKNKIDKIYGMIGNYRLDGNIIVIPDTENENNVSLLQSFCKKFFCKCKFLKDKKDSEAIKKNTELVMADSEFNAYTDPDGFSQVIKSTIMNIIPLDCTNYIPLSKNTFNDVKTHGDKMRSNTNDKFILSNYDHFIELLKIESNTPGLYLWDVVATLIFLDLPMDQKSTEEEIDISWTGRIVQGGFKNRIYNFIDYDKCIKAITTVLFSKV